jgi:predicted Zn finger-like uncharacterized protein
MRLTCPNCGAQYEVQDAMIPPAGRDVQCSACSATWFQRGPQPPETTATVPEETGATTNPDAEFAAEEGGRFAAPDAARQGREAVDPPWDGAAAAFGTTLPGQGIADAMETATQVVDYNDPADDEDVADADAPANAPTRSIDPSVRDILRAEAEREARLRKAEASPVETQAEMPLEADPDAAGRSRRLSRLSGPDDAADSTTTGAVGTTGSRRDLLPNIEEINSTLRARPPYGPDVPEDGPASPSPEVVRRRGVRIGFFSTLALVALVVGIYANAPAISERLPQAAPALAALVDQLDVARQWLDDLARGLAESDGAS